MNQLIPRDEFGLFADTKRTVWADSRHVAKYFHKNHNHVLRDIQNLNCSREFNQSNFGQSTYIDAKGETRPSINMTRDGFTFLAMGYRGKKAAEFKEAYIRAFNALEKAVREQQLALAAHKPPRRSLTDAIRDRYPGAPRHFYINFTRLAYKAAGVPVNLPNMTPAQIAAATRSENVIAALLDAGMDYQGVKAVLAQTAQQTNQKAVR